MIVNLLLLSLISWESLFFFFKKKKNHRKGITFWEKQNYNLIILQKVPRRSSQYNQKEEAETFATKMHSLIFSYQNFTFAISCPQKIISKI